ncbi:MAG: winged helix-turn-helix domain-containing protein [Candidatus Bathyarchaeia archaeon]
MEKSIHPKAYLIYKRNVKTGLHARSKIIQALESGSKTIKEICEKTGISYSKVIYHLKLLLKEKIIKKVDKTRPYLLVLTEFGQQKLAFE